MFYIFLASVLFGLVHPGSKIILSQGIDLLSFCILYVLIRLIVQIPFVVTSRSYRVSDSSIWPYLWGIGIVGAGLQFCEFKGIAVGLSVPLVTFIVYSHPLWSLLFSRVINKEPLRISSFIQLALGLLGILLVAKGDLDIANIAPHFLVPPLIASVLIALWVSLANKAKQMGSSAWNISFYYDLFAFFALVVLRLTNQNDSLPLNKVWEWLMVSDHFLTMTAYAILVGLLPNILFYLGNENTKARTAGLMLLVEPVVATVISSFIWSDQLSPFFFIGSILILFAGAPMTSFKFPKIVLQKMLAYKTILSAIFVLISIYLIGPTARAGDSPATHGMLVFGDGPIYLSHLPMFHSPHNYQVILRVDMGIDGNEIFLNEQQMHSDTFYTLVPEEMVLPDIVKEKKSFKADLYRGHFEREGIIVKKSMTVAIKDVIYFHKFDPKEVHPQNLTYLLFGSGNKNWLAHIISQKPDFDQIAKADTNLPTSTKDVASLITIQSSEGQNSILDGHTYTGTDGSHCIQLSHIKTKYLERGDLEM